MDAFLFEHMDAIFDCDPEIVAQYLAQEGAERPGCDDDFAEVGAVAIVAGALAAVAEERPRVKGKLLERKTYENVAFTQTEADAKRL